MLRYNYFKPSFNFNIPNSNTNLALSKDRIKRSKINMKNNKKYAEKSFLNTIDVEKNLDYHIKFDL